MGMDVVFIRRCLNKHFAKSKDLDQCSSLPRLRNRASDELSMSVGLSRVQALDGHEMNSIGSGKNWIRFEPGIKSNTIIIASSMTSL